MIATGTLLIWGRPWPKAPGLIVEPRRVFPGRCWGVTLWRWLQHQPVRQDQQSRAKHLSRSMAWFSSGLHATRQRGGRWIGGGEVPGGQEALGFGHQRVDAAVQ